MGFPANLADASERFRRYILKDKVEGSVSHFDTQKVARSQSTETSLLLFNGALSESRQFCTTMTLLDNKNTELKAKIDEVGANLL